MSHCLAQGDITDMIIPPQALLVQNEVSEVWCPLSDIAYCSHLVFTSSAAYLGCVKKKGFALPCFDGIDIFDLWTVLTRNTVICLLINVGILFFLVLNCINISEKNCIYGDSSIIMSQIPIINMTPLYIITLSTSLWWWLPAVPILVSTVLPFSHIKFTRIDCINAVKCSPSLLVQCLRIWEES